MTAQHAAGWSRREFLSGMTVVGAVGLLGLPSPRIAAEPPPETTTLRLTTTPAVCLAPQYVATELLRGEGFREVQYVKTTGGGGTTRALATGEAHISTTFSGPFLLSADAGDPIVLLAGGHVGCFELFGTDHVRAIRDLKGKTVAVPEWRSGHHVFIASLAAYVGLDPGQDIHWVIHPRAEAKRLFAEGQLDAYLGFPPDPQELRARRSGQVVVNSTIDRPWSQYFCCMLAGNREFVARHPVATKRALRAMLKAADLCAREPARVAQLLVDHGDAERYEYALQTLQEIPYGKWREYDAEDTVRF